MSTSLGTEELAVANALTAELLRACASIGAGPVRQAMIAVHVAGQVGGATRAMVMDRGRPGDWHLLHATLVRQFEGEMRHVALHVYADLAAGQAALPDHGKDGL